MKSCPECHVGGGNCPTCGGTGDVDVKCPKCGNEDMTYNKTHNGHHYTCECGFSDE